MNSILNYTLFFLFLCASACQAKEPHTLQEALNNAADLIEQGYHSDSVRGSQIYPFYSDHIREDGMDFYLHAYELPDGCVIGIITGDSDWVTGMQSVIDWGDIELSFLKHPSTQLEIDGVYYDVYNHSGVSYYAEFTGTVYHSPITGQQYIEL